MANPPHPPYLSRKTGIPARVRDYWKAVRRPHGPHAYARLLGLHTDDAAGLRDQVEKGLEYRVFEGLSQLLEMPGGAVADLLLIPSRTLQRRRTEGRLRPDESDRLLRLTRVFGRAIELFQGDHAAALRWMRSPRPALGGATPLDMSRTEPGTLEVERLIGRVEQGVFS